MRAVLLDIEGTVTDKRFVTGTLFPYARDRIRAFVRTHAERPEVADAIAKMREAAGEPGWGPDEVGAALERWIDEDRKAEPLKRLQGMIWATGYGEGSLKAHVYPDVPGVLARWRSQGKTLAIFSSGSVAAQKLLFQHTEAGDLTAYFSHFFDLTTGSKKAAASYRAIAATLRLPPVEIRFYSDLPAELAAAREAGMEAVLVERDGPMVLDLPIRRVGDLTGEDA